MKRKQDILTLASRLMVNAGYFGYSTQADLERIHRAVKGDPEKIAAETDRHYHIEDNASRWRSEQTDGEAAWRMAVKEYQTRYPGAAIPRHYLDVADDEAAEIIAKVIGG